MLSPRTVFEVPFSHRSALMIQPPVALWPPIQAIRSKYDSSYERWMPHINLLFGFVPEEFFPDAVEEMAPYLADISPFTITLRAFSLFEHRKSLTLWLRPDTDIPNQLQTLFATVSAVFPQSREQSERGEDGFVPHLTVAKFSIQEKTEAMRLLREWQESWTPLSFLVNQVFIISRREEDPFEIRHEVELAAS